MSEVFSPVLVSDTLSGGVRSLTFKTCGAVCSEQIDIDLEGDVIKKVRYTRGCHGNTQGVAALCEGRKVQDVIGRLDGIDCKGRGTSCPDQLARALRIARVVEMERLFDALRVPGANVPESAVTSLREYMDSGAWLSDYEADERGEIPAGIKRGVLSQDGLYNLLQEIR